MQTPLISEEEFRGAYLRQLSYGRFSVMSGLRASLKILPVPPAFEGTQSLMGMSAWGHLRKLRSKESQIYGRQLWGSLAASQILSSNACMKYILPSTLKSNKVWLKSCSNCTLSDARYLILSSLGSFAIWSKRDLDLFQTFTVETWSMAWSHWDREKKNEKGYWRSYHLPFGRKTHGSFACFSKLFCHKRTYTLLQHQEIPILPWNCFRVNMMTLFLSANAELRTPVMMNSHLPSSLPLLQRHFLPLVFAKLILLQTRNSKPEKQKKRTTSYILSFPLLFRKPPAPVAIQLYLKPGSRLLNTLWHMRYPWGPRAGSDVP